MHSSRVEIRVSVVPNSYKQLQQKLLKGFTSTSVILSTSSLSLLQIAHIQIQLVHTGSSIVFHEFATLSNFLGRSQQLHNQL